MKWINLFIILVLLLPVVSAKDLIVKEARVIPEYNDVIVSMTVQREFEQTKRMNFAAVMFDYDVRIKKTNHQVDSKITSKRFLVEMPEMEDGCYMMRLTASNNHDKRVKHREVCVKNGLIY
jgi:hypothetical protein